MSHVSPPYILHCEHSLCNLRFTGTQQYYATADHACQPPIRIVQIVPEWADMEGAMRRRRSYMTFYENESSNLRILNTAIKKV